MPINLKIITPEGTYIDNVPVDWVNVQTNAGEMTIYPRHAQLVSTLKIGTIKFTNEQGLKYIHVHRGILQVTKDQVKILTQWLYEIDAKGKKIGPKK
ncbi:F0F1 ATP synthase subunit epsilon [Spiroplasma culicicola]|uniref:F0F1 ATP synthase subunit epsilon n=1 Tax=Spiroplasma culicicola AES-1 TaxID=1276246 RepID=W6A5J6_9MOLU|nr:F0F1 ATP synthase subunit epsilon [Spiroplasma culicicola]AHI52403.1 F0F1 ATP synthase subunit epsilon [Spiroplasma culicicola AES-1]